MNYRLLKICILLFAIVISTTISISAQDRVGEEIDIRIYFPYNESHIDSTYMDNLRSLHYADSLLRNSDYVSTLCRIEVTAQSSPDGSVAYNQRLSERRMQFLEEHFTTNYPHIDSALWSFHQVAENWEMLHQHFVDDENLPSREAVLSISNSDISLDDKEEQLRSLDGGKPWRYINEHIFPYQRFAAKIIFTPTIYAPITPSTEFDTNPDLPSTALDTAPTQLSPYPTELTESPEPLQLSEPTESPELDTSPQPKESKLLFALKTNLLLDVASVINIAIEVPIGNRWSIVGEVIHPWWRSWDRNLTMQIESYHAELKCWLGDRATRERLTGWSLGAYGGWGRYDIQPFSVTGVQGDLFDVGLHVGYAHRIAKSLHLEYTLGLGYLSTNYEDYTMVNNTSEYGDIKVIPYPWMNSSLKSIFPTRLGISLVWLIKNNRRR